jgi:hypothetical protein
VSNFDDQQFLDVDETMLNTLGIKHANLKVDGIKQNINAFEEGDLHPTPPWRHEARHDHHLPVTPRVHWF